MMFEKSIVLKCGCGKVVRIPRHLRKHPARNVILCDGNRLRGTVTRYALFKERRAQYQVRVIREWMPIGHDTYTLFHKDDDMVQLVNVSRSLGIALEHAAWVIDNLGSASSEIEPFVTFAKKQDYTCINLDGIMKRWKFISRTEFQLLTAS